jgi:hypothetical protein
MHSGWDYHSVNPDYPSLNLAQGCGDLLHAATSIYSEGELSPVAPDRGSISNRINAVLFGISKELC